MKKLILSLFGAVFLSLASLSAALGESGYLPALGDIYWHQQNMTPFAKLYAPPAEDQKKPLIAIVIDDMGVDRKRSARAVANLAGPVTLAYLPYSRHIKEQAAAAKERGHEVILHLPWEPDRETADPGLNHLSVDMTKEQLEKNLLANLDGFTGYTGVNNHMGSKFSRYRPGLEIVMAEVSKRGVFFLDSRTAPGSLAGKVAKEHEIPTLGRDVFLDHVETPAAVAAALKKTENIARKKGSVIAIGHPKDMTLDALEAWIPAVEAKGFQLVSLSELLKYRQPEKDSLARMEQAVLK